MLVKHTATLTPKIMLHHILDSKIYHFLYEQYIYFLHSLNMIYILIFRWIEIVGHRKFRLPTPTLPPGVASCEGVPHAFWNSKCVTLTKEAGDDVANGISQTKRWYKPCDWHRRKASWRWSSRNWNSWITMQSRSLVRVDVINAILAYFPSLP